MKVAVGKSAANRLAIFWLILVLLVPSHLAVAADPNAANTEKARIPRQVLQVLKRNCLKCHGISKSEGELQLHSASRIWKGGETGPAVIAKAPEQSLLWQRVSENEMPPELPLTGDEKKTLRDWIAQGAIGLPRNDEEAELMRKDEHWAFTKLQMPPVPHVHQSDLCRTSLDQFLQAELENAGLELGPETDRHTLIRRVSFSLTGLPPSPEEIAQFLADNRADAVETMIDRYLASPQYGIRWGKHWLDAAGYADSNGYFNADTDRPLAYRYRDYVVRSINADKPFDQFVREQIAGDELSGFNPEKHRRAATPEMLDMLIATHYLRNGQDGTGESDGNPDEVRIDRYTALESAQQIIASSLLGLTVQCAKCHDHKFEPLTQLDFYRFQSVLYPAFNPNQWIKPNNRVISANLPSVYDEWETHVAAAQQRVTDLQSQYRQWVRQNRLPELVLFADEFTQANLLDDHWTATIPGDDGPAGTAAVTLRTSDADVANALPAALISEGRLKIIEGGTSGDKWLSTRQTFDWTPEAEGSWIQVTFDLLDNKVHPDEPPAARIAFGIALHDFDNNSSVAGGDILIDGNPAGGATVHLDYPSASSKSLGNIGSAGYVPDRSYGVRITHLPDGVFRLQHLVDALPDGPHIDLKEQDLPNGSFGFGYCCGRSYQVDNLVVEISSSTAATDQQAVASQAYQSELQRRQEEILAARAEHSELQNNEPGRIAWITDSTPEPPEVYLLARGDYSQPQEKVYPAPLSALHDDDDDNPMRIDKPLHEIASSGRRTAWAVWVTQPDSRAASLMARVQVNRVWQHHFGTGIVSTPENLGMSGANPTNVALLDWLAGEFIRSGWSLKSLHRLILRSAAFRQSSLANDQGLKVDPQNQLLWRYPLRRLDAESIRDAQLAISGELDLTTEGPYVGTTRNDAAEVIVPENQPGAFRRSIYLQQRRSQGLSLLNVFDAPVMVINCTRRPVTTMPLQSLSLLNSEFAVKRGQSLAKRIEREAGKSADARIRRAFLLATGRECNQEELSDAVQFIESQQELYTDESDAEFRAWSDFCQLLLASNACLYLE